MDNNIYKAPEAEIIHKNQTIAEFYVVSSKKFLVLFFSTLGLYSIYWFYEHWALYKVKNKEPMWPVMRAIFQIFFAHSLFERIDSKIREGNESFDWSPSMLASIFVVLRIIESVTDRLSAKDIGSPMTDTVSLLVFPFIGFILWRAQKAANIALGDPEGKANANFTAANYIWVVIGCLFWLIAGFGMYAIMTGIV